MITRFDHVTVVVADVLAAIRFFELQLMQFHRPAAQADPNAQRLDKLGYNHICFAVSDIEAVVAQL